MKYKIPFLVSILIFVFLSIANVVLSTGRVDVGTPACEVFISPEGQRCAVISCNGTQSSSSTCYDDQGYQTTLISQSKNICERFTNCTMIPGDRLACDPGNKSASYGKECNGVTSSVSSGAISCPISCTCPNPIGTKPCNGATWDTNTCQWNIDNCGHVGGNPTYECDPYCQGGEVLVEKAKSDGNTSNLVNSCCILTPIVVDIDGDGFSLTSAANGVMFDFNGDGVPHLMSWTKVDSDEAWLVLDRNSNGTIDDGSELFGNLTPQPQVEQKHGFLALAEYDKLENGGNEDGKINKLDTIFSDLRLWQDKNHNGISERRELKKLRRLDVKAFKLNYKTSNRVDRHGNAFRYKAKVKDTRDGNVGKWAWDVFLVLDEEESDNLQDGSDYDLKNVEIYR